MEGMSHACDVYFTVQNAGPRKTFSTVSVHSVVRVQIPALKLPIEEYCRYVPRIRDLAAQVLSKISLPRGTLLVAFTHITHDLHERIRQPVVSTKENVTHSQACRDCRWFKDAFDTDLVKDDDYKRFGQTVATCLLGRMSAFSETSIISELNRIDYERAASSSTSPAETVMTAVEEQMLTPSVSVESEIAEQSPKPPVDSRLLQPNEPPQHSSGSTSREELLMMLDDPLVVAKIREAAVAPTKGASPRQMQARNLPENTSAQQAQEAAMWRQVVRMVDSSPRLKNAFQSAGARSEFFATTLQAAQQEDRQAIESQAQINSEPMAPQSLPFEEDDLPTFPEDDEPIGIRLSRRKRRSTLLPEPNSASRSGKSCNENYDSDTVVLAHEPRMVKVMKRVEVPKRTIEDMMNEDYLPIDGDDEMTEEDDFSEDFTAGDSANRSKVRAPATTKFAQKESIARGSSSTTDTERSQSSLPDFQRKWDQWRSSQPGPIRNTLHAPEVSTPKSIVSKAPVLPKSAPRPLVNREKPAQHGTQPGSAVKAAPTTKSATASKPTPARKPTTVLDLTSTRESSSSSARSSPEDDIHPQQHLIPTSLVHASTSGRKSRQPAAAEIDEVKISRDADRIVGHKYTGKRFVRYYLRWLPDRPGWLPAHSWVPPAKFSEDAQLIRSYEASPEFHAREEQARAEARLDRTDRVVSSLRNPRRY